jgi:A/G-specific adenine glycosylase
MPSGQRSGAGSLRKALADWYRPRRRAFAWRRTRDPYAVLVSEVMLQQTQAPRVEPAYDRFLARFPTVVDLARASRADVLRAWDGLGYNRRAVALSEAARTIVSDHAGVVPSDVDALRALPGIGPYTAAAVASIAYGERVAAVDTNVRRIVARVHVGSEADEVSGRRVRELADAWLDRDAPGEWNQALMDLGREICRPRPRCTLCPIAAGCAFLATGAEPRRSSRRQGRFAGSSREVRGAVIRCLRERSPSSLGAIASRTGLEIARVAGVLEDLHREGLIVAGDAALQGRSKGRVRLSD